MTVASVPTFAERLKELRENAEMSQYALAKKAGLSKQAVSMLEKGDTEPTWLTVRKIAHALGVSVAAFEQDGDPDPPAPAKKPKKK